jgi:hypothetical protein
MFRPPLSGSAQPVSDTVKRAMELLKNRPEPRAPAPPQPGTPEWRPRGSVRFR